LRQVGRDLADVELTHLSTVLVGTGDKHVTELSSSACLRGLDPEQYAATAIARIVDDHIGRFRELAVAGAHEVVVRFAVLIDAARLAGSPA
jgi:hypothetical protein